MTNKEEIYIAKVRKNYSSRRRTYVVLIATFLILAVPLIYHSYSLSLEIKRFTENVESEKNNSSSPGEGIIDSKMNFYLGLSIGAVLSGGFFVLGTLISAIFQHHFNFKKDGLLLKYYDAPKQ